MQNMPQSLSILLCTYEIDFWDIEDQGFFPAQLQGFKLWAFLISFQTKYSRQIFE